MLFTPLLVGLGPAFAVFTAAHSDAHANLSQIPDDILQRNAVIQAHLAQKPVRGVKKMSNDEGEKFFLDYWYFEEDALDSNGINTTRHRQERQGTANEHLTTEERLDVHPRSYPHHPSILLDRRDPASDGHGWMAAQLSPLFRRDFKCPTGTFSCASIDRPDSCCNAGETCELVKDTGSGDVGCCPSGQDCSGTIGKCKQGYSSCSASQGGGCCIPGYECVTGGCARVYTITITLSSTVMISTSTQTVPATSTVEHTTTTSSAESTASTSSKETKSTGDLSPPARPTSLSTATTSDTRETGDVCPLGFYACSAVYRGGCCQTGRDCDTTSCPSTRSKTITTNDRTIVVPVETTGAATTGGGRCATGWFSCADTAGGGCCPTGYACGSSCTAQATATATGTVAKEAPTNAASRNWSEWTRIVGVSMMGMLWTMG
ncbi:hypothetical protein P170DRAFT_441413 [Aspergillus steynii IBT 23096]|uniref:GPI anchored protein n=1 Tax=Aspergillus steynii IBT 23096 TaxID=1392250 RepID=A0A2I2FTK6_9EURO|nr:uncharacterized protein P170DRAFT_441413 [Aspergillus steynii IBT 23096]PLB43973.1 hypothetical protein P170DRAFT_441413 [Aspergillus steynii IBT 23096]